MPGAAQVRTHALALSTHGDEERRGPQSTVDYGCKLRVLVHAEGRSAQSTRWSKATLPRHDRTHVIAAEHGVRTLQATFERLLAKLTA